MKWLYKLIPSRVRVKRNVTYEVVYIDEFQNPSQMGECRFDEKKILLKKDLKPTWMFRTFIHELLHASCMEEDIPLTENQVLGLEEAIYRVLRLNKWL